MVFDPDLSNEHENVLRAMLAGTNRKINIFRSLPKDVEWFKSILQLSSLSQLHVMCEQSWGREFGPSLAVQQHDALTECAAMNLSLMASLAKNCSRFCQQHRAAPETTDKWQPMKDGEGCGRHCNKMNQIFKHYMEDAMSVNEKVIVVAERREEGESACVLLEGNHRAIPLLRVVRMLERESQPQTQLQLDKVRIEAYLGISAYMRNSTFFYGVAAGLERTR
mmetsp:Transcript_34149/g.106958  ORF Transcript_34149/g.106958 Transcript_34149/m.106958 type:complete len:222 (-) Transcript_34149:125-790(-)